MRNSHLKIMMSVAVLAIVLVACNPPTPMPNSGEGTLVTSADQITNTVWEWNGVMIRTPASQSVVPDPQNYTLTFLDNGLVKVKADCNLVSGTYTMQQDSLVIALGPGTLAYCGDNSLDTEYRQLLAKSSQGAIQPDGQLYIYLIANEGRMSFTNGGPAPK